MTDEPDEETAPEILDYARQRRRRKRRRHIAESPGGTIPPSTADRVMFRISSYLIPLILVGGLILILFAWCLSQFRFFACGYYV